MNMAKVIEFNREGDQSLTKLRENYLRCLTSGDHAGAASCISGALASGITARNIYLQLLIPAQEQIGVLWHEEKISLTQEHVATEITFADMGRLRPLLRRQPSMGKRAVITCVEGESHSIGARIAADFMYMDGWDVEYLGANTPTAALVDLISKHKPDVVGLSVVLPESLLMVKRAVVAIRHAMPNVKILVGGLALTLAPTEAANLGADALVTKAQDANEQARKALGMKAASHALPEFLKGLGARLSRIRKEQRLSQQEVADVSGLERAYISAVEHGKHNVTVGAVMKLAAALDVSIKDLLLDE